MYKENARVSNAHPGTSYSDKCLTEEKILKGKKHFLVFKPWHHSTAPGLYGKALQRGVIGGSSFKGNLGSLWSNQTPAQSRLSHEIRAFQGSFSNEPALISLKNPTPKIRIADSPDHLELSARKNTWGCLEPSVVNIQVGILTSLPAELFWSRFLQEKWPHRCSPQCHPTTSGWSVEFHPSLPWSWSCWMGLLQHCPSSRGTWVLQCFSHWLLVKTPE